MKKSVILTIIVIYIVSVIVVGFIGPKLKVYGETVYVTDIKCISEGYKKYDPEIPEELELITSRGLDGEFKIVTMTGFDNGETIIIPIICELTPNNATNSGLEYFYEAKPDMFNFVVNPDGTATITVYKGGSFTLTVESADKRKSIKMIINITDFSQW